ncbi:MAG: hypothetical protein R2778_16845 [Saprospiraceae bacterium]
MDNLVQKDEDRTSILSEKEQDTVKTLFEEIAKGKPGSSVQLSPMAPEDMPVMVTRPEFMRRMKEMQAMHGMGDMGGMPDSFNIVVNTNHPVIATKLVKMKDKEKQADLSKYLVNMALLQQGMLRGEELTGFLDKTLEKL